MAARTMKVPKTAPPAVALESGPDLEELERQLTKAQGKLAQTEARLRELLAEGVDLKTRLAMAEFTLGQIAGGRSSLNEPARASDWHLGVRCVERAEHYFRERGPVEAGATA